MCRLIALLLEFSVFFFLVVIHKFQNVMIFIVQLPTPWKCLDLDSEVCEAQFFDTDTDYKEC